MSGLIPYDKKSIQRTLEFVNSKPGETKAAAAKISALQQRLKELETLIPKEKFDDLLDWTIYVRPTVAGRPNYLPYIVFWHDIFKDKHSWLMLLIARQMWKSNYVAARMARRMVQNPLSQVLYATYEDDSLTKFSTILRYEFFKASEILSKWIKGSTFGSVEKMELITDAIAWLITHAHRFTHAEGKSTIEQDIDESQYIDWENYMQAREAQSFTQGDFCAVGIGGEEDTPYHKMWKTTDQREWKYDNEDVYIDSAGKEFPGQGWRKNLQYNEHGLMWGSYMKDALKGYWNITRPDLSDRHGYHLSQLMAPWIPLSAADAKNLYKISIEYAIETKQNDPNNSQGDFIRNVLAGWTKGDLKPFPRDLLLKLISPKLKMLRPSEVDYELGDLYLGVDWGGGNRTVRWIYQVTNDQIPVFRLINCSRLETKDVHKQYEQVVEWMDDYSIKQAVVDGGGGTHQVQELEKRYGDRVKKFFYLKRPGEPTAKDSNEEREWNRNNQWQYDKTWMMERVKDYMSRPHMEGTQTVNKIVLPGADVSQIEWIIDQFGNEITEKIKLSAGQYYTRYYTDDPDRKPDDALHAQNLAIVAWDLGRKRGGGHIIGTPFGETPATNFMDLSSNTSFLDTRKNISRYGYFPGDFD